jgi:hypothetical protein
MKMTRVEYRVGSEQGYVRKRELFAELNVDFRIPTSLPVHKSYESSSEAVLHISDVVRE